MSSLSRGNGSIPEPWGYPSRIWVRRGFLRRGRWESGGFVYNGVNPATQKDIDRLNNWAKKYLGRDSVHIDEGTLVGRRDKKNYSTFSMRNKQTQRFFFGR
jgi:hypothetical protein